MVTTDRSYVICHMMSTIEGKIDSGIKGKDILGDYFNQYIEIEHIYKPQAWMCGRVTTEMFADGVNTSLPQSSKTIDVSDCIFPTPHVQSMVTIDTKGALRWKTNTITSGSKLTYNLIVIVTHKTPKEYLAYLQEKQISYIFCGEEIVDFLVAFQKLKNIFHIDTLCLEGGGLINGSVMAADLIDEISLLVTPLVLNRSNAPVVFERKVEEVLNVKKYKLFAVKQMENDSVWLRYKI
jgi:2,5-diamino-6-(ribosylamino)-4(3H)-pyrimidinone 5'-phosphate reductase